MPEINSIFIDDPKRLSEPIKAIEVRTKIEINCNHCEFIAKKNILIKDPLNFKMCY